MIFKRGDLVLERPTEFGLVFVAGPKSFDVIFVSGFVSRHRQGQDAYTFDLVDSSAFQGQDAAAYEADTRAALGAAHALVVLWWRLHGDVIGEGVGGIVEGMDTEVSDG